MSILDSAGQNLNVSLFDVSTGNCSSYDSIVFFFFHPVLWGFTMHVWFTIQQQTKGRPI